jgi:hypothetical protein
MWIYCIKSLALSISMNSVQILGKILQFRQGDFRSFLSRSILFKY